MSTRQLIFVGCKILGMYLIVWGLGSLPMAIASVRDQYTYGGGPMQAMLFSMSFGSTFLPAFQFLTGLLFFFRTEWITKMIAVDDKSGEMQSVSQTLSWGIGLTACIYVLLTQFPTVLLGAAIWFGSQVAGQGGPEDYTWQRMISREFPLKSTGCVVALIVAYLCLRAMYGKQPFRWWNGNGEISSEG